MAMKTTLLRFSPRWACNIYVLGEEGEPAIIIDPGSNEGGALDRYIEKHHRGCVSAILLTHCHIDHWLGLLSLRHKPKRVYAPLGEKDGFLSSCLNLSALMKGESLALREEELTCFADGETLNVAGFEEIETLMSHFHTPDGAAYYFKEAKTLFSGDALFHLSVGRSDLPGGNERSLDDDLRVFAILPPETKVYPGHDESTTIGNELRYNPHLASSKWIRG